MTTLSRDWPTTRSQEAEWDDVRAAFLSDSKLAYLNSGSWGVLARPTYEALTAAIRRRELNPTVNRAWMLERVAEARGRLARLVGARAEDIAFLPNVTVAINTVINGLDWPAGAEIVASDQEYNAINNCLHNASRRWGVEIRRARIPIPPRGPEDVLGAFAEAITDRTHLVLCSHITSRTGLIAPIEALAELAHSHGAMILVDGAHGPGMIPLQLDEAGCDFYGGNCHKWLCAPKGVGFLHAAPGVQQRVRHLVVSWGYSEDGTTADESGRPLINDEPYMWGIETWGTVGLPSQVAAGEAVRFQMDIGPQRIAARGRQLAGYLRHRMAEAGWAKLISPTHPEMTGSISTFELAGFGEMDLQKALRDRYRITAAGGVKPPHALRVSTHIYNTFAEIDRLADALGQLRREAAGK